MGSGQLIDHGQVAIGRFLGTDIGRSAGARFTRWLLPENFAAVDRDDYGVRGGRSDIVDAVRGLIREVQDGKLQAEDIDEVHVQHHLYTHDLPDPDLLIRTSGETRISNFLLWQLAYTELYFTPTLWPDFRRRELLLALLEFQRRERRFGRVFTSLSS